MEIIWQKKLLMVKRNSIVASVVIDITRFEIMGDSPCIKGCKRFFQPYDSNKPSLQGST